MRALAFIPATVAALAVLSPSGAASAEPRDPDFDPDVPVNSLALGPAPSGTPILSMDVGWLRSGVRLDLGITSFVGLILSADTMLLYRGLSGETGVHIGVRLIPFSEGSFRLTLEGTAGEIYIPVKAGSQTLTQLRGDILAGTSFDPVTVYARLSIIGEKADVPGKTDFLPQEEIGLGVEYAWKRYVFGAEGFVWARSGHAGMMQWRLRAGIVL